jgi:hypothetical protein
MYASLLGISKAPASAGFRKLNLPRHLDIFQQSAAKVFFSKLPKEFRFTVTHGFDRSGEPII